MALIFLAVLLHRVADGSILINLDAPQRAAATGQIAAIWDGDWCLGCGTIDAINLSTASEHVFPA